MNGRFSGAVLMMIVMMIVVARGQIFGQDARDVNNMNDSLYIDDGLDFSDAFDPAGHNIAPFDMIDTTSQIDTPSQISLSDTIDTSPQLSLTDTIALLGDSVDIYMPDDPSPPPPPPPAGGVQEERREGRRERRERREREARRRWTVRAVTFAGNDEYRRRELLSLMELRPRWPRYNVRFTNFLLNSDIDVLQTFYRGRGFEYAEVTVESVERDTTRNHVRIKIAIDEGPRVHVDSVYVSAERFELRPSEARRLATRKKNPLIHADVRQDVRTLTNILGTRGHLAADVVPQIDVDPEAHLAHVLFNVSEGPRAAVGNVHLIGNDGVRNSVLRRELVFRRGDTLDLRLIQQSERRLYSTNLFNYVHIAPMFDTSRAAVDQPDSTYDVRVFVDLSDFLRLQGRVGYSTDEGVMASASATYMNMFRRGQALTVEGRASQIMQGAEVSYSMPGLFFMPFSFNTKVYYNRYDNPEQYQGAFSGLRLSIDQRADYRFLYQVWTQWERLEWLRVPSADAIYEDGVPETPMQSVGGNIGYDSRNNLFNPTSGSYTNIELEVAGIFGGEHNRFVRVMFDTRRYFNYRSRIFLSGAFRAGVAIPYGASDAIPIQSKFYGGGGGTVRGFPVNRLAVLPGDIPMMGDFYTFINIADISFPIIWWINGAAFLDAGNVWTEFPGTERVFNDLRWSAGPGIRVDTPIKLIARLDLGFKLDRREGESAWELHFDLGRPF